MVAAFGILASILILLYGIYFSLIIRGIPYRFEQELLVTLNNWLKEQEEKARFKLLILLLVSLVIEIGYFILAFLLLHNPFMIILTLILAGEELLHLMVLLKAIYRYCKGLIEPGLILNWTMERVSAVFFFTHALLALISLLFYH